MYKFSIGDRVVALSEYDDNSRIIGVEGTIVKIREVAETDSYLDNYVGVEFDIDVGGHDLDGTCKFGKGWYFYDKDANNCLEAITPSEPMPKFDDLF